MHNHLDRNLVGYGAHPPDPQWPGEARIAVSFVLNYEEGGENTILNGDAGSEIYLTETPGGVPLQGARDLSTESIYEYGSRAGFWRILRLFAERNMRFTSWAVGRALELNPVAGKAMAEAGHEVASHGWRWINYKDFALEQELDHIRKAVKAIKETAGKPPVGWYTGRFGMNTLKAVVQHGGFLYSSDSYNDDLPYWVRVDGTPHLVIPYTLEVNDMKFAVAPGFTQGDGWLQAMKDAFDVLYAEGARSPKMMSVGLHCRLAGRPSRAATLARFLDYVGAKPKVWVATREEIARHWMTVHPAP
ncbi:allantoinase PuuE [Enhydrobacter sp.]|jgi:putative urate catabolism protein|uniref:allantoinase PuuE n=1 Tax=Enhydrobacter sp. TaxID=1894999 RepID=UPI0026200CF4|nr:allantoinase PuuE [Enhydrobacter sp.]WIM12249.1 MAG: Uricase (urate oxidase) [Enhydrobacter sp.]